MKINKIYLLILVSFLNIIWMTTSLAEIDSCEVVYSSHIKAELKIDCSVHPFTCFEHKIGNYKIPVPLDYFLDILSEKEYRSQIGDIFNKIKNGETQHEDDYKSLVSLKETTKRDFLKTKRNVLIKYLECVKEKLQVKFSKTNFLRKGKKKKIKVLVGEIDSEVFENERELKHNQFRISLEERKKTEKVLDTLFERGIYMQKPEFFRFYNRPQQRQLVLLSVDEKEKLLKKYFYEYYFDDGFKERILFFVRDNENNTSQFGRYERQNIIFHKSMTMLSNTIIKTTNDHYLLVSNMVLGSGSYKKARVVYDLTDNRFYVKLSMVDEYTISQEHDYLLEAGRNKSSNEIVQVYYVQKYRGKSSGRISEYLNGNMREKVFIITDFFNSNFSNFYDSNHENFKEVLIGVRDSLKGIHCLHSKGIIHLDIKEDNILLNETSFGKYRNCAITDLGLSCFKNEIDLGTCRGTLTYADPLYYAGVLVDESSDLWSLGATIFNIIYQYSFLDTFRDFLISKHCLEIDDSSSY